MTLLIFPVRKLYWVRGYRIIVDILRKFDDKNSATEGPKGHPRSVFAAKRGDVFFKKKEYSAVGGTGFNRPCFWH